MASPRVVLVDDNPIFCEKLTALLGAEFDVAATAADGQSALDIVCRIKPEVVVLDLGMPQLNGMQVTRELVKHGHTSIVICSLETDPEVVEAALEAGAIGYVYKTRIEKDLILAVKAAVHNRAFVSAVARQ